MFNRRQTKKVFFGEVPVGGQSPISVQSMTNTSTENIEETRQQIQDLEAAGCEIIRVGVPDGRAAAVLDRIKAGMSVPLVADIHFDYKLALTAVKKGVDGLRLNPGNIEKEQHIKKVLTAAKKEGIPIRIGVNSGSISRKLLRKYGHPTADAMVESAFQHINLLKQNNFEDIVISLKSTDIAMTVKAYEIMAEKVDYPFHIGITEAGPVWPGTIKSAVGLGSLLTRGLGDTIRVSLTGDPVEEVKVGWEILKSLGLRQHGPRIISCPTCARARMDVVAVAQKVREAVQNIKEDISIAIMGCEVNGPGEAREADIGVAAGDGFAILFKKGRIVRRIAEDKIIEELLKEIDKM